VKGALEVLRGLRERGLTLLLIDHKLRAISAFATRALALDRGEIIAEGSPGEVTAHPRVVKAYLGEG
jgi:branched-chain amino acid transport system ATP-binding protein